ncbi:MAG: glycosyltransferase family 4 protein [Candidatus Binataceae bacterium]
MKIGINLVWLVPGYRGLETYARGLLAGLDQTDQHNRYVLFTNPQNHASFAHLSNRFVRRLCPLAIKSRVAWRIAEQVLVSRYSALEQLDLLHSPADLIPLKRNCATVVTIHDVNFYSLSDRLPAGASRLFDLWARRAALRSDAIITVSRFSKEQISAHCGVPDHRISVIYNAAAIRSLPSPDRWPRLAQRLGLSSDYIVTFSDGSPHKNLGALLQAFARLGPNDRPRLAVVGDRAKQSRQTRRLLGDLNLSGSVIFTGYLCDDELSLVLGNARMLALPSTYEGFGLPVVEAMAAGVPVACSRAAALPEIAGNAAVYFAPADIGAMARAITTLLADELLRSNLAAAGRARAGQFSWPRSARRTIEVYERTVEGRDHTRRAS